MKKIISIVLSLVMLFSLLPTQAFATDRYADTADSWAENAIDRWSGYGVIEGYNGKFNPYGTLTRAQMAAVLSRLLALPEAGSAGFSDVRETEWYAPYINSCFAAGIMLGSDGKAQPDDPITREQAIVMLSRALGIEPIANADLSGYTDAASVSDWARGYVAAMAKAGVVQGTSATTVSPMAGIDRASTVTILDRAIGTYVNTDGAAVAASATGMILIAADNVTVTGAAKGATVIVSPSATGVSVNGVAVAAGTTTTASEEKKVVSAGGSSGGGQSTPTPSGSDLTIREETTVTGGTYENVTIASSVGNGEVTLSGVTITGKLIVQGGGSNSIHVEDSSVPAIQIDKSLSGSDAQPPRIALSNTPVQTIEAVQPAIIEADHASPVKNVEAKDNVTIQGEDTSVQNVTASESNVKLTVSDASVNKVTAKKAVTIESTSESSTIREVEAQSNVTVQGAATKVENVTVPESASDSGVTITVDGAKVAEVSAEQPVTIDAKNNASPIEKVEAKDDVTVKGDAAQIETVEVPDTATKQPVIEVQSGTVSEVKADKPAEVKGSGTVTNVEANAEVKVDSATVTTITVTVAVTVTITGSADVEVAVETTQDVSVTAESAKVAVSTTQTTEVSVQVNQQAVEHIHKWVEDTTQYVAPTCKTTGKRVYVCGGTGTCDVTERTKTETLAKLPHTEQIVSATAATCTESGLAAGKVCAVCHEVLVAQTATAALGHDYAAAWSSDGAGHWHECRRCGDKAGTAAHTPGAAATETTDQTCSVCGYVITPSTGHQCSKHLTKTAAKAATCTAAGNSAYYTCTCGKYYSDAAAVTEIEKDSWVIAATGHSFGAPTYEWKAVSGGYTCTATRTCTNNANHKETEAVTATYAVTKNATCQAVGSGTYTAKFTNPAFVQQTKTVEIAKLLHTELTVTGTPATCTETGLTDGVKCSVCHTVIAAQQTINALGHSWATVWSSDAADHWHICTREGCAAVGDKAAHTPGAAATETTAQSCTECGYVLAPATGHVCKNHLTKTAAKAVGTTTAGNSEYYTCTCGKYYSDADATNEITKDSWIIPASYCNVSTQEELQQAMSNQNLLGAILAGDLTLTQTLTVPTGKTLTVPAGKTLTVNTTLNVYGTLNNEGDISNLHFIDVFGGTLSNSGTITGVKDNPSDTVYASNTAIENGATLTNTGTILDCIAVGDYYRAGEGNNSICTYPNTFDIASDNFEKIAVAMGAAQIQSCLNLAGYEMVTACGTDTENENVIDLSNITVPAGKTLLLKASVSDGTNTYQNRYTVSSGTLTVEEGAYLICKDSTMTVAAGAKINAYSFARFSTLIVSGHVYTEKGGMQVATALTVNDGGKLEIGSESGIDYQGTSEAVVNGTLMKTVRYRNGMKDGMEEDGGNIWMQSGFSENIAGKVNATMTTLVITEAVLLDGDYTVDAIIPYAGTLQIGTGSLKYKQIMTGEGFTGTVTGNKTVSPDENGYYTLTTDFSSVATFDTFKAALTDENVRGIIVNADITVPAESQWTRLEVKKPVIVAGGKTLTVAAYETDGEKSGFLANDLTIVGGGSLTLAAGATLATGSFASGEDAAFYRYVGRVCVAGGTLDISAGTVANESFFNFTYCDDSTNSDALILGENTPAIEFSVHNDAQLRAAISNNACTSGVILENNIELLNDLAVTKLVLVNDEKVLTIPAGKTVTVAEGATLQVSGTVNVYGTLNNEGDISNLHFIDVFGGTLSNSGSIKGNRNGEGYDSNIGIENGAVINNFIGEKGGTIYDSIAVADYYRAGEAVKRCTWNVLEDDHTLDPRLESGEDNPNFDVMAVGFGTDQIQAALNARSTWGENNENSAYTYEYVLACGTDYEAANTVELGGITVHEYGMLLLKASVNDGEHIYTNNYQISEGLTLTLEENAVLMTRGQGSLAINGSVEDQGAYISFGSFTVTGAGFVSNKTELLAAISEGGTYHLLPFTDADDEAAILGGAITVSKDTVLINHGNTILYIPGLTVAENKTLTLDSITAVLAADSSISGTVELRKGSNLIVRTPDEAQESETTALTIAEGGTLRIGNGCGVGANSERWKIVNNGTIEQFGDMNRDEEHFTGNAPLEFATLRDLVCELYNQLNGYDNMTPLDLETTNEYGIEDLHWVYAYPDGGDKMYNSENPDDSDYDAIGAFSWFIKNGVIPEYDEEESSELKPYELVTKADAAALMNKLGNKIAGTTNQSYTTLSGDELLCRTENIAVENEEWKTSELRQVVDALKAALPLPTVSGERTYQFSRFKDSNQNNEWVEAIDGGNENTVRNLHFTEAVTIRCNTTQFEENNTWGGGIHFENCQFDKGVTVYYNDSCQCRVDFTDSCTFGSSTTIQVVREDAAELFNDVCVELVGMPEGTKITASAPVDVNNDTRGYVLNGFPVVGSAGLGFDCDADHGEASYDSVDHNNCDSSRYLMRLEIHEGGSAKIDGSVDISSIPRLNNAGTITVNGTLTVDELNNQCFWDSYENAEEGRTAHLVCGRIVVSNNGTLTANRLNNDECWEGEGDDAQKKGEASISNSGTITVNAQEVEYAVAAANAAAQIGGSVIVNLQVSDDSLPEGEALTVNNLTVNNHLYIDGALTVTGTLTIAADAELEVASVGSLTYSGNAADISNQGRILKTVSYMNGLETVFNQSTLSEITAEITLTSLVITEPVTISKNTDVDFLVIYQEEGATGSLTVSGSAVVRVSSGKINYLGCDENAITGTISQENGAIVIRANSAE